MQRASPLWWNQQHGSAAGHHHRFDKAWRDKGMLIDIVTQAKKKQACLP
ncbi:hypothetical protein OJJOAM_004596 [Cupriavidus sp. H18C1]